MTKERKLLLTILSGLVVVNGLIVGFAEKNPKLTMEEAYLLVDILNYEIKNVDLNNIKFSNQKEFYDILTERILNRNVTENSIKINNLNFKKNDYLLLRESLIKKSKPEKLINQIIK